MPRRTTDKPSRLVPLSSVMFAWTMCRTVFFGCSIDRSRGVGIVSSFVVVDDLDFAIGTSSGCDIMAICGRIVSWCVNWCAERVCTIIWDTIMSISLAIITIDVARVWLAGTVFCGWSTVLCRWSAIVWCSRSQARLARVFARVSDDRLQVGLGESRRVVVRHVFGWWREETERVLRPLSSGGVCFVQGKSEAW